MSRQPTEAACEWRRVAVDALLSHARNIAEGSDEWVGSDLRTAFVKRVTSGEDPLGEQYSRTYSSKERRSTGATLTPSPIVHAMIGWTEQQAKALGSPARVVDPGAGTGRFAIAAGRTFPSSRIVAIENDPRMVMLLRANLRIAGLSDRVEVVEKDFRAVALVPAKGPTLFVGNPPYVRHHGISADWKRWYVDVCAKRGIKASQLAGLHLHFFAKVAELGSEGDYGCFITASEWLDVGYGAALRSLLANGLGGAEIHILEPTVEAFPGTMTTAAITGFRIGRRSQHLYIRRTREIRDLHRPDGGRAVDWAEVKSTAKWSLLVYTERRPDAGNVELGEICRVHRGQVTGNNRIWIAGPHAGSLPERLLKPTVTRAGELIKAEPILANDRHLARVVDLPPFLDDLAEAEREAVERFLVWAKNVGGADGYIAKHRNPWWAIRLGEPAPIICTYMARRPPAFVRNLAGARLLNIAHGIYPREELTDEQLQKLVATLRANARREFGRTYAGGLTKFEPREIERLPIPANLR
jgi:predicted RNA methylase